MRAHTHFLRSHIFGGFFSSGTEIRASFPVFGSFGELGVTLKLVKVDNKRQRRSYAPTKTPAKAVSKLKVLSPVPKAGTKQ